MAQIAYLKKNQEAQILTATIESVGEKEYYVVLYHQLCEAQLAASCLLKPQVGDTVLLAHIEGGAAVILSVLYRNESSQAHLVLPAQSTLDCAESLTVRATAALSLQSGQAMNVDAHDLNLRSHNASANMVNVSTIADKAEMCARFLSSMGQTALSVFSSVTQCFGKSQKMVTGTDETHCQSSTLVAEEEVTTMSKNAVNLAKDTSRTDAKLIQLG